MAQIVNNQPVVKYPENEDEWAGLRDQAKENTNDNKQEAEYISNGWGKIICGVSVAFIFFIVICVVKVVFF